jgi:hypothetical protein
MGPSTAVMRKLVGIEFDRVAVVAELAQRGRQDVSMTVGRKDGPAAVELRKQGDARAVGLGSVGIER